MSKSILTLPDGIFCDWPIRYNGNIINPIFDLDSIADIVGITDNHVTNMQVNEPTLYEYLGNVENEFSCKLFYLIVEKLNWIRLMVANETCQISPFNPIMTELKEKCRMASLMLKKYQYRLEKQCLLIEEDRELSKLLNNMKI
jgi:hypothetical protein